MAGRLVAVDVDGQHRQAGGLLDLYLGGTRHALQAAGDLRGSAVEHVHVITEQLYRHIAAHPGNQLVEAQLDRLRQLVVAARYAGRGALYFSDQLFTLLARVHPLLARAQHHVGVGNVRRHRVGGNLGSAGAGEHPLHFRHLGDDRLLQALLHVH
ncbi:hypothetical protein D3C81_1490390 [compost metagenome]